MTRVRPDRQSKESIFVHAALKGDFETVKEMLDNQKVDVNCTASCPLENFTSDDDYWSTPEEGVFALFAAANQGHEKVVKLLLDYGADRNQMLRNYNNATAERYARTIGCYGRDKIADLIRDYKPSTSPRIATSKAQPPLNDLLASAIRAYDSSAVNVALRGVTPTKRHLELIGSLKEALQEGEEVRAASLTIIAADLQRVVTELEQKAANAHRPPSPRLSPRAPISPRSSPSIRSALAERITPPPPVQK